MKRGQKKFGTPTEFFSIFLTQIGRILMETITKNGINSQNKLKIILDYIGPYCMKWPKKVAEIVQN